MSKGRKSTGIEFITMSLWFFNEKKGEKGLKKNENVRGITPGEASLNAGAAANLVRLSQFIC